jgi:hypothetical protein
MKRPSRSAEVSAPIPKLSFLETLRCNPFLYARRKKRYFSPPHHFTPCERPGQQWDVSFILCGSDGLTSAGQSCLTFSKPSKPRREIDDQRRKLTKNTGSRVGAEWQQISSFLVGALKPLEN